MAIKYTTAGGAYNVPDPQPISAISGDTKYSYNGATNAYDSQGAGSGTSITQSPQGSYGQAGGAFNASGMANLAGPGAGQNRYGMTDDQLNAMWTNGKSQAGSDAANVKVDPGKAPGPVGGPALPQGSDTALLRAKDRQGQLARGALTGLRAALGDHGALGAGVEGAETEKIAGQALQNLTDVNREQLSQDDETARQFGLAGYQGAITQRGQDISARGQDIQAQTAQNAGQQASTNASTNAIMEALKAQRYLY